MFPVIGVKWKYIVVEVEKTMDTSGAPQERATQARDMIHSGDHDVNVEKLMEEAVQLATETVRKELEEKHDLQMEKMLEQVDSQMGKMNDKLENLMEQRSQLEEQLARARSMLQESYESLRLIKEEVEEEYIENDVTGENGIEPLATHEETCGDDNAGPHFSDEISPGATARLHGLRARPALNGEVGSIESFDVAKNRWQVLLRTGEHVLLKTENLQMV